RPRREARPTEDRQRDRAEGAKAACLGCGYLEAGQSSRHRDWHRAAHLQRDWSKEGTASRRALSKIAVKRIGPKPKEGGTPFFYFPIHDWAPKENLSSVPSR